MLKTHVMKMNTENANCFIYETEELLIELLGGVRIEGLDRICEEFLSKVDPSEKEILFDLREIKGLDNHNLAG